MNLNNLFAKRLRRLLRARRPALPCRRRLAWLAAVAILPGVAPTVCAQEFPNRPVRLIAVVTAGGGADNYARILARRLSDGFGQQVVVDNRGGANGIIGSEIVARAAPDGYTLLFVTSAHAVNPAARRRLPYDTLNDFAPVSLFTEFATFLTVNAAFAPQTLPDLLALARAKPGQINYGATAPGSALHLAAEMMNVYAKVKFTAISYKGAAEALTATIAGETQFSFHGPTVMPHVRAGRLRALAVTSASRSTAWPEIPTMQEGGVPNYHFTTWHGVLVPRATPAAIVARLAQGVAQAARDPAVIKTIAADGAELHGSTPAQFQAFLTREVTKFRDLVQAMGGLPGE